MDDDRVPAWLGELNKLTALIVPTRSLATSLNAQISNYYIEQSKLVWESPNILVWSDYLRQLWHRNTDKLGGAHSLINNQQSLLLWTQVVEASRRQERSLTLLNVQQTAKAVQRSWRLMHDWCVIERELEQDHVEDIEQFLRWLDDYHVLLTKRGLIDESLLMHALLDLKRLDYPFERLIWHSYDLVTEAQQRLNANAIKAGVQISVASSALINTPKTDYRQYQSADEEIRISLLNARELIEQEPQHQINIVIPNLQHRQTKVREIARDVFYPGESPLAIQQMDTVYRFSLGQPLNEWAGIEAALSIIELLKNNTNFATIGFLFRNQFLYLCRDHQLECRLFERWLKHQRIHNLLVDNLPALYKQCLDSLHQRDNAPSQTGLLDKLEELVALRSQFQATLDQRREQNNFAAISFIEWVNVFEQWLQAWDWRLETDACAMTSVQYQLFTSWRSLLEEFASLTVAQSSVGLSRAIEILRQMARDTVFLPQAALSPILICGVYEAIGRPVDTCMLTGMNKDYPPAPQRDAFVPNRLVMQKNFPDATAEGSFKQAKQVVQSLVNASQSLVVSFALFDERESDIQSSASALYRDCTFTPVTSELPSTSNEVVLDNYQDTQGQAWAAASSPRGGSQIFENQSNCAFKAYLTHQLRYDSEQEAEFGLDALDRGNVVHRILELVWGHLLTQKRLKEKSESELQVLIAKTVEQAVLDLSERLSDDKAILLQREKPRLRGLITRWLELEAERSQGFRVTERERHRQATIGGIDINYTVDRVDCTDDGRSLIIDYKTGAVARSDWTGERIAKPQMPLYSLALGQAESLAVAGIAYAKIDAKKHELIELCEVGILKAENAHTAKLEDQWREQSERWPALFAALAEQFLAGDAQVNPIEEKTCLYCDLQSVCRVSQLRQSQQSSSSWGVQEGSDDK